MALSKADIIRMHKEGKIRGFQDKGPAKGSTEKTHRKSTKQGSESKAKLALREQLLQFARDKSIDMREELEFYPGRRWRFDFAFPGMKIAVEYEGGIFTAEASHSSIGGITRDIEKYNAAATEGWRVFRYHAKNTQDATKDLNKLWTRKQ